MSNLRDGQKMQGKVKISLKEAKTGRIVKHREIHNKVVTDGRELVAKLFIGELTTPVTHMAVGSDGTEPSDEDHALRAEIGRVAMESLVVSTEDSTAKVKLTATFGTDISGPLQEAGIFTAATGGIMYNRVTFPVINKGENHTLTLEWEIIFPPG